MSNTSEISRPFTTKEGVEYAANSVVSKTIIKKSAGTVTLFAFDQGEGLSEHTTPFDAIVQVLDGVAEITIGGNINLVHAGQSILLPASVPHALKAIEKFKMMLTMIKN